MARDIEPTLQDFTDLDWSESEASSAMRGSYLKARRGDGCEALYYKLSCHDEVHGIYGHECVNEILAARLMDVLCIEHVPYRLVHARVRVHSQEHTTWLVESPSFRRKGESKQPLADFFKWNKLEGEDRLSFCTRFGWLESIQKMVLVDYLIANRDRHGNNLEVVKGSDGRLRLAPLFDNGLSLCFSTYNVKQLATVDPLQDIVSNNFLGTRSLEENLVSLVPSTLAVGRLRESHKSQIAAGLAPALEGAVEGVSGEAFLEFLWRMIWERWCVYETLRDSGRLKA